MNTEELKELFDSLSLKDKLGQMTQVAPMLFSEKGEITGPIVSLALNEEDIWRMGTILGGNGASETKKLQEEYLKHNNKKIPLIFMSDVIHGYKTIFPIPLAIGSSWNPECAYLTARISAVEACVSGVHVTFSPMVDLVRDPRWGRVMESTGEDPYLNSLFAKGFVYGYQIENEDYMEIPYNSSFFSVKETLGKNTLAACAKHFAGYGASEAGRDYNTVDMSMLQMRQFYLPSYKACVDAGCELVMTAFNIFDGIPCTASKTLLRDILRREWGFKGVTISDWGAVQELVEHGLAEDKKAAAFSALLAGTDIEMMTSDYYHQLEGLCGQIPELLSLIDEAAFRILILKNKLGLFENPYRFADEEKEKKLLFCGEHRKQSRKVAGESIVLLKNNDVLPLEKKQKIALIGPLANSHDVLGGWSLLGEKDKAVTLSEGLMDAGYEIVVNHDGSLPFPKAVSKADVLILALGEESELSGEGGSLSEISLKEEQVRMVWEAKKLKKPVVVVLFNGRPLILTDMINHCDAIVEAWFLGSESGNAVADILSGEINPSGRLSMSFPYATGQIPVYYNHFKTGRPAENLPQENRYKSQFLDIPNEPLFPFGYGLSYSEFKYFDFRISNETMQKEGLIVSVQVKNKSSRKGKETVQFYLQDIAAQVVRPVKQLIHFAQVLLEPGEEKEVSFRLTPAHLYYYNAGLKLVTDPGKFLIMAGANSKEVECLSFSYEVDIY